jgi:hypothetical protein
MNYAELVQKRKAYKLEVPGLINQSEFENGELDAGCYLAPWAKWHNSTPAKIVVIGQDWGETSYYKANNGRDHRDNPTCKNLKALFEVLGIDVADPENHKNESEVHFTNIIPFLRTGLMQGELHKILDQSIINKFADEFTKPLISIIKPAVIITLGMYAFKGIASLYQLKVDKNTLLKDLLMQSPFELPGEMKLFPMFHCGNRNLVQQKKDWAKVLMCIR